MAMKKTIFLSVAAVYLLSSTAVYAQMSVQLNVGAPAYIVAPVPVYASPYPNYYDPRHRRHDFEYWQHHRGNDHREHADNGNHEEQAHGERGHEDREHR